MNIFKQNIVVTVIIIVVIAGLLYYLFVGRNDSSASLTTTTQNSPISGQLLTALTSLQTISLDGAIFSDPTFLSLTDFSVSIPPQSVGRGDPFAPLGSGQ